MAASKRFGLGKVSSPSDEDDELTSSLALEMAGRKPLDGEDEDDDGELEEEAFASLRAALKSGDDAAGVAALKELLALCGASKGR